MPDYLLTLNFTPLGFVSSILPYFIIIICITLLLKINKKKINIKDILFKYYFNNIYLQKNILHFLLILFMFSININNYDLLLFYLFLEFNFFIFKNNRAFAVSFLSFFCFFLLFGSLEFFVIIKFMLFLFVVWKIKKPKELKKPNSLGSIYNSFTIFNYHKSIELQSLIYIEFLCVVLGYFSIISNSVGFRLYFLFTLFICSIFSFINFLLSSYLNPFGSKSGRLLVGLSQIGAGSAVSIATLHVMSTTSAFEVPDIYIVKKYQTFYYGYTLTQTDLLLKQALQLKGIALPKPIEGKFDTTQARVLLDLEMQRLAKEYAKGIVNNIFLEHKIKEESLFIPAITVQTTGFLKDYERETYNLLTNEKKS